MIEDPERSQRRDAALDAMLPLVPTLGWGRRALRTALEQSGAPADDADLLFPGGVPDILEAWCDLADRRMAEAAVPLDLKSRRVTERVRALIALRLTQAHAHRDAIRHALGLLALPRHAPLAARTTARTVDAIWHAAGDTSADFSWYTKRGILASVYVATLLFWLRDTSEDDSATLAFLDRRLADVARIGAMRRRLSAPLRH
jgi:ubiquinone biosynthesis protein COQ9